MQNYEMYDGIMRKLNDMDTKLSDLENVMIRLASLVGVVLLHEAGLNPQDLIKEESKDAV